MHDSPAPADQPMTALPMTLRQVPFRVGKAVYRSIASSPAAPILKLGVARRVQKMLIGRVRAADVLEIVDALESAGVKMWVAGGWGVDALLGEQTRKHPDLDLVLDISDEGRAEAALRELGFKRYELEHDQRENSDDLIAVPRDDQPGGLRFHEPLHRFRAGNGSGRGKIRKQALNYFHHLRSCALRHVDLHRDRGRGGSRGHRAIVTDEVARALLARRLAARNPRGANALSRY